MARQRSQSTSSVNTMARSPTSLSASLSISVALYDNQQPPKTLQDILLQAQSHYISHRYVPALTLYKLAAERHHSLAACCSLYALYTTTQNVAGLVRSDTKATQILLHALRIWTARRWSNSRPFTSETKRTKTKDDHDELEEYFAQPKRLTKAERRRIRLESSNDSRKSTTIPVSDSHHRQRNSQSIGVVAASVESEYRSPLHMALQHESSSGLEESAALDGRRDLANGADHPGEKQGRRERIEEQDELADDEDSDFDDDEHNREDEEDEEDEEHEKEEEARRIGLATTEIEDIVQKLCSMIQKGVLGLDEPVLVEAVSALRHIERGMSREAEAWKQMMAQSKSMFSSSLLGGNGGDGASSTRPSLLLTQGMDLSFLNQSTDDEDTFMAKTTPISRSPRSPRSHQPPVRAATMPVNLSSSKAVQNEHLVNPAIADLPTSEREQDLAMCRALRIRIMYTLGWVHHQKGEYHYGAQAYGVCSEISTTGKRQLNALQLQAKSHRQACSDLENKKKAHDEAEQEQQQQVQATQPTLIKDLKFKDDRSSRRPSSITPTPSISSSTSSSVSTKVANVSRASSVYTSCESPTSEVSIPSSLSNSSESGVSGTISLSSFSAAVSGLFRLEMALKDKANNSINNSGNNKPGLLQRSKSQSVVMGLKAHSDRQVCGDGLDETEAKDKDSQAQDSQHRPRPQKRSNSHYEHQGSTSTPLLLTMSGHQKKAVQCGHCGQTRILMPLCACKKVRYCNGACRVADLKQHRLTGCHAAAKIGNHGPVVVPDVGDVGVVGLGLATSAMVVRSSTSPLSPVIAL